MQVEQEVGVPAHTRGDFGRSAAQGSQFFDQFSQFFSHRALVRFIRKLSPVSDVKWLPELEAENAKLKRMYADLALENAAIIGRAQPKAVRPSPKRQIADVLVRDHHLPVQRACRVVRLSRTAYYLPPVPASRRDAAVIAVLTDTVNRVNREATRPLPEDAKASLGLLAGTPRTRSFGVAPSRRVGVARLPILTGRELSP